MKMSDCHDLDEVFTHEDPDTGVVRRFNATHMVRYAISHRFDPALVAVDENTVQFMRISRGIEAWKVKRLKEPYLSRPVLLVEYGDGTHLCVDGHHRIVRRWDDGLREVMAWIFPKGEWDQFVIEDM